MVTWRFKTNSGLPFSRQVIGAVVAQLFWLSMKAVLSFIARDVVAKGLDHDTFVLSIREIKPKKLDTEPVRSQLRARSLRSDRVVCVLGRYVATEPCTCSSDRASGRALSLCSDRASVRALSLRSDRASGELGRYVATETLVAQLFWLCMKIVLSFIAKAVIAKELDYDTFVLSIREIKPKKLDTEPVRSQLRGDFLLGRDQAE
ncbi:hypothetical protein DY000_02016667 [Brassica cretica]|uniref:Uncharacterized protein n=1 Tax=Brassica cretica TaxID=69181 RepID=A0ABQ7D0R7_BRACR|nr:hypothetical protein DY000_02016667 [Brassica cretica]